MVEPVTSQSAGVRPDRTARGRWVTALPWVAAALVTAVCWMRTVGDAQRMAGGMPMPGGWTMSMAWMAMPGQTAVDAALMFLAMWQVMMVAMMLPSAMPVVLLHRRLMASHRAAGRPAVPAIVLLAGYFAAWGAFGLAAFGIGFGLSAWAMRDEVVSRAIPALTGVALLLAGAYQLTPLKRACLHHCRSPLSFFMASWTDGWRGTLRLGLHHGAYCVACCWALMVVQLVVGVMSLPLMLAIAVVIAVEKLWRHGDRVAQGVGALTMAAGLVVLASSF